jgi:hypothetical protein
MWVIAEKTHLFCRKDITSHLGPITKREECNVLSRLQNRCQACRITNYITHIYSFFTKAGKDRMGTPGNCAILTLDYNSYLDRQNMRQRQYCEMHSTHRACIIMVYWEGEAGKKRYHDTTFPRSAVAMSTNDALHDCIPNVILNLDIIHDSSVRACKPCPTLRH